jgi:hypothetical protein
MRPASLLLLLLLLLLKQAPAHPPSLQESCGRNRSCASSAGDSADVA